MIKFLLYVILFAVGLSSYFYEIKPLEYFYEFLIVFYSSIYLFTYVGMKIGNEDIATSSLNFHIPSKPFSMIYAVLLGGVSLFYNNWFVMGSIIITGFCWAEILDFQNLIRRIINSENAVVE